MNGSFSFWLFRNLMVSLVTLLIICNLNQEAGANEIESFFWERNWKAIDQVLSKDEGDLSSRDLFLYANSLWIQKRWEDALPVMLSNQDLLPDELIPYQEMLVILGYERTGQKEKALRLARTYFAKAPLELKYYVAYALARMEQDNRIWYSRMLDLAENSDQKKTALTGLVTFPDPEISIAVELMKLEPQNRKAQAVLFSPKADKSDPEIQFYRGYSLYLKGSFADAVDFFETIPLNDPVYGLRAGYYMGFSCYRLKRYEESMDIWKRIALEGKDYSSLSARRIANMAGKVSTETVLKTLQEIADSTEKNARLIALYYLSTLFNGDEARYYEEIILKEYPLSDYAIRSIWDSGWSHWQKQNYREAINLWRNALKPGIGEEWEARLLYWIGAAEDKLGNSDFKIVFNILSQKYPFSIYTFRAFPNGAWQIADILPEKLQTEPSLLESWGFIPYARIWLQRDSAPGPTFRSAVLASWMGDEHSAFMAASKVYRLLTTGGVLSRDGLKLLYPRPYYEAVSKAAQRFSVEPALIWSIMRQESAFDPNATSYVGACGLMQLMPGTAQDEAQKLELGDYEIYDTDTNILLGAAHISWLMKRFKRLDWSVAAYNAGSGSVGRWIGDGEITIEEWIEDIPYLETYDYLKKVLSNLYVYRLLYDGENMERQ